MKHETEVGQDLNPTEARFMARLREHPEVLARFQSILELTRNPDGPLKTADQVAERLILELRQLGNRSKVLQLPLQSCHFLLQCRRDAMFRHYTFARLTPSDWATSAAGHSLSGWRSKL